MAADGLRGVPARAHAVRRSRIAAFFAGLLVALTPEQLVWSATAAVEPSASLACVAALAARGALRSIEKHGRRSAARRSRRPMRSSFDPSRCLILPVVGVAALAARARRIRRARDCGGPACCSSRSWPSTSRHLFAVRNEGWGTTRRATVARLRRGEPARQRVVLPGRRAVSRRLHAARDRRAARPPASPSGRCDARRTSCCSSAIDLAVLRRQLQLRRRRPVFPHDLSAACHPRRARCCARHRQVARSPSAAVLPAHGGADGRARVPVPVVCARRPCDDGGSVGGASGRAVCEVVRPGSAARTRTC